MKHVVASAAADDTALMDGVAARDQRALAALYDRYSGAVMGACVRILRDRSEAEEATCDVFIELWNRSTRFDPERGHPLGYLLNIARSRAIDRLRVRGRRERIFATHEDDDVKATAASANPFEDTQTAEKRMRLQGALSILQPGERRALELAFFDGMSHTEVAAALGEPLGTVKTRIRQGLLRMRETLASAYGEGASS